MKTILIILSLCAFGSFNLCAKASLVSAEVTLKANDTLLFSPRAQGVSGQPIRFSIIQKVKNNDEKISVGGTLELTATVLDQTVSFKGVATVSDLTGQASEDAVYATAITAKEFHFSGQCTLGEITLITIEGKDGVSYDIILKLSDVPSTKYQIEL